jgi:hypothetical protein
MADTGLITITIVVFAFLIIDLLVGLACIACGIWFHASADVYAYMTVFVRSQNDGTIVAAAGILLALGFLLTFLTLLAGFGVLIKNEQLVKAFIALIWIVLVLGLICGFMCVGFKYDIHRFVKNGMLEQLQNRYSWDGRIGKAWNRVQVKKRCCGVDGSWDYRESDWFANENSDLVTVNSFVPKSCCVLNFNQDRELSWVDPQNLQPKDLLRCNQDAEGYKDGSANLHGQGCFAALFSKNRDVWHDQHIFTVMDVISGLGITAGLLQIFAIAFGCIYLQCLRSNDARSEKHTIGRY